jgi:3-hydroxy-9,10-secoandrosta-1,3,5(10)-triene-9,17-dione monooxygenase
VLVAIQIRVNVHGADSFAESSPTQQFWRDANTAARHTALNTVIRYKVSASTRSSLGWYDRAGEC